MTPPTSLVDGSAAAGPLRTTPGPTSVRTDIQGLRAIAVTLVLLFHLWPRRLTGGFVGVDVFFVISGFLITSHLLAHPPERVRDLAVFWARRVQRLLPASLLVLAVSVVGTRLFAPETIWGTTAIEVGAAALYVVNWRLASNSVDYLAAENTPSPVQHFWSLSIEEQFYAFWPILLLALFLLARRSRVRPSLVVVAGLALVVLVSLAYSVQATGAEPARAYFVTPTRIWELGLGGLLAALLSGRAFGRNADDEHVAIPVWARIALAWLGLVAIAWTALTFTGETPFPSWRALLPVLGTVAVIAASAPNSGWSPGRLLALRPSQFLGDISYSVYLWHWPFVVLVPYATGHALMRTDKLAIIVVTLVLATLTKRLVEDTFRAARWRRPLVKPYLAAAVAMGLVVLMALGLNTSFERRQDAARSELAAALSGDDPCFGALALAPKGQQCPSTEQGPVVPAPAEAIVDKSDAYDRNCWEWTPFSGIKTCTFGDPDGTVSIALVGNSHAGQWLPALQRVAERKRWKITTFLASECTATTVAVSWDTPEKADGCLAWGQRVLDETRGGAYDLVVTAERNGREVEPGASDAEQQELWEQGYRDYLEQWQQQDQHVLVLHDLPFPASTGTNPPECVAENMDDLTACGGQRSVWVPEDPLFAAARSLDDPRLSTADLTDFVCGPRICPAAVGGVLVYFDGSHVTATYNQTMAPFLADPLVRAVDRATSR